MSTQSNGNEVVATADYWKWRQYILTVKAEQVGLNSAVPEQVYGILMDLGMIDSQKNLRFALSTIAFASGEASFRPTPGAGVMGLGGDPNIAKVAETLVQMGQNLFSTAVQTQDFELPMPGIVRFLLYTTSGFRVLEKHLHAIQSDPPLNDLLVGFGFIRTFAENIINTTPKSK